MFFSYTSNASGQRIVFRNGFHSADSKDAGPFKCFLNKITRVRSDLLEPDRDGQHAMGAIRLGAQVTHFAERHQPVRELALRTLMLVKDEKSIFLVEE